MKKLVWIALVLVSTTASALDLKGVKLGMTRDELLAAFPGGSIKAQGRPLPNGVHCLDSNFCSVNVGTLAGIPMQLQVNFLNGKVSDAYSGDFYPTQFDQVVDALKSKFGPPTTKTMTTVQNRMGNSFDNPQLVWKFPEGELRASRFMPGMPTLEDAQLEISTKEWLAVQEAKRQKRNADL